MCPIVNVLALAQSQHSCKGLEFPLAVMPGADRMQGTEELPPEEACLLYVALTRATRKLVVSGFENDSADPLLANP